MSAYGLLKPINGGVCEKSKLRLRCGGELIFRKNKEYKGGYALRCKNCSKFTAMTKGTFFHNAKLGWYEIFLLMLMWCCDISVGGMKRLSGINADHTLIDWSQLLRDICSWKLLQVPQLTRIGGPGHVVQEDESVITRRKYHRGRHVRTRWIVGCYDPLYERGVIVHINARDENSLIAVITEHVLPGSEIWTDCWRGYDYEM